MKNRNLHYKELRSFLKFLKILILNYNQCKYEFSKELNFFLNKIDDIMRLLLDKESADENLINFKMTKLEYIDTLKKYINNIESKIK